MSEIIKENQEKVLPKVYSSSLSRDSSASQDGRYLVTVNMEVGFGTYEEADRFIKTLNSLSNT